MTEQGRIALDYMVNYPAAMGRRLGYTDLRDDLHGMWMHRMLTATEDMTLQAHRGSYKTTCLCIVLAVLLATEPDKTMMFLRKTDDDVVEVVKQVARIIDHPLFQQLTSWIYAKKEDEPSEPLKILKGTGTEITCDNYAAPRGSAQLLGIGVGGSLTGKHADIVVTDDIINLRDRISGADRKKTRQIYQELQNVRNPGGRFINTGTPWHKEDAFTLMPPAEKYDCYTTKLLSSDKIQSLRESMEPSLFAANYELRHIAQQNALFADAPKFTDDKTVLVDGIAHIDASYGGEDYTAFTVGARYGDTLYLYGRMWRAHIDTVMDKITAMCDTLLAAPVYCETNGDKGYLAKQLRAAGCAVSAYPEKTNKYVKISTYLRKWWKNIVWVEGTDPDYLAQIMDYTEDAQHDDAPDSAACVCRILDRKE